MTPWLITQCLYVVAGGLLTPPLVSGLFARGKAWGDLANPAAAFVVVVGVLLTWPLVTLLILEGESDR